jgi:uncharacterized membrane protein YedE/YeeE
MSHVCFCLVLLVSKSFFSEFGGLKPFGSVRPKELSVLAVIIGGFLVGFGAKLGNGCTSGHGVCGLGRLSVRSLCAVLVFLPVAMLVASFVHSHDAVFSLLHSSSVSSPFHYTLPHAATAVAAVAAVLLCVGAVQIFLEPASRSAIAEGTTNRIHVGTLLVHISAA